GQGKANPIGAIWSGALLLRHLGEEAAAARIEAAIDRVTTEGEFLTGELGGRASTSEVGDAIAREVRRDQFSRGARQPHLHLLFGPLARQATSSTTAARRALDGRNAVLAGESRFRARRV